MRASEPKVGLASEEFSRHIEWENPTNGRGYEVYVRIDLLGDISIQRIWWGKQRPGGSKYEIVDGQIELERRIEEISAKRLRNGYKPV